MTQNFEEDAKKLALNAINYDKANQYELAISYYIEASQSLINAKKQQQNTPKYDLKINQYLTRAEQLKTHQRNDVSINSKKSNYDRDFEKVICLLNKALDEDAEKRNYEYALELYTDAIGLFLQLKSSIPKDKLPSGLEMNIKKALEREIQIYFKRAEEIKSMKKDQSPNQKPKPKRNEALSSSPDTPNTSTGSTFTSEEIDVLRYGSTINGRNYMPFLYEFDCNEKFFFPIQFTDKDGFLEISKSQKERFREWIRPDSIYDEPKLMMLVSSFSVKQTCISDCSFIASLTVCAQYERKFNKNLLDRIIYPKNKNCEPVYNPCGKYMIILNINGCERKVIIDDYLPVDSHNNLLCSQTTNRGELWVSLLEKAYLKIMGGYDFPGSNSNIDLNALTSWIPERISIGNEHSEFQMDSDFERMFERFHSGDCLITVSTGQLSKDDEERTGLVPTHAYACIDIRKFNNKRLFQLKNPWSHLRWKGNYSEYDITNWTPDLRNALNYDPKMACNIDNGVFWIDYESLIKFYDVFYLNWNPKLFPHTTVYHRKWSVGEGPVKDRYNLSQNPQYLLKIKPGLAQIKKCSTWVLLTRHIVDKEDFAENKEYIALIVYKNNGKRIFYPNDPTPLKDGVRINSPHYLVKLTDDIDLNNMDSLTYTLVLSQYEKSNTIYYSIRAYSTLPFDFYELKHQYKDAYDKNILGKWIIGSTAGGCSNFPETFKNNPLYKLEFTDSEEANIGLKIELKGPQQYSVGFEVSIYNTVGGLAGIKSTGDYRKGFCVLEMENLKGSFLYQIRPTTYLQNQEGPFILAISSTHQYNVQQIK